MLSDLSQHMTVDLASLIGVAALAFRNQLILRLMLLLSTGLTLFALATSGKLDWDGLFWTSVTWMINGWVTVQIVLDRTHLGLTDEEEELFSAFGSLTPGEFRRLIRPAIWHTAEQTISLTREGVVPDRLFYVLSGAIEISKGDRPGMLAPQTFIGEIAFLRHTPASATVSVAPGARYLEWRTSVLSALLDRHRHLRGAVTHLLSADMALKVARASTG